MSRRSLTDEKLLAMLRDLVGDVSGETKQIVIANSVRNMRV